MISKNTYIAQQWIHNGPIKQQWIASALYKYTHNPDFTHKQGMIACDETICFVKNVGDLSAIIKKNHQPYWCECSHLWMICVLNIICTNLMVSVAMIWSELQWFVAVILCIIGYISNSSSDKQCRFDIMSCNCHIHTYILWFMCTKLAESWWGYDHDDVMPPYVDITITCILLAENNDCVKTYSIYYRVAMVIRHLNISPVSKAYLNCRNIT